MTIYPPQKKLDNIWLWIRHRLALQGLSFGKLARIHNIHRSTFGQTKHRNFPKYERILADLVGQEPWDLWPERYDAAHNPIRISTRYQGHKHFLDNIQNNRKSNGKDRRRNSHEAEG